MRTPQILNSSYERYVKDGCKVAPSDKFHKHNRDNCTNTEFNQIGEFIADNVCMHTSTEQRAIDTKAQDWDNWLKKNNYLHTGFQDIRVDVLTRNKGQIKNFYKFSWAIWTTAIETMHIAPAHTTFNDIFNVTKKGF